MNNILLVALREFRQIAMMKSFWLTLLLVPVALALGPIFGDALDEDEATRVAVIDRSQTTAADAIAQRFDLEEDRALLQSLSRHVRRYELESADPQAVWTQHDRWYTDADVAAFREAGGFDTALDRIAAVAPEFDAVFFAPYLFATTFFGALIHPHKSVLIPCLHDEHYAYLDIMQSLFRQVRGALFNSAPEMELAQRLYRCVAGGEVGMGFDLPSQQETSSIAPYFKEEFPYIVYLGRKETGKGAHLLIDHFCALKAAHEQARDLRLVVCGGGDFKDLERPEAADRDDIIDLTLTESEKLSLLRHALFLAQPSVNESFSIVLMEAWLLGTPVVVNAFCPVTRSHAAESGGGLYFGNQAEFCAVSLELLTNRDLATAMGQAGREYVQNRYNWDAVLARFDNVMQGLAEKA